MIVVKGKEFIHDEIIDMHLAMLRPHIQKGGVWLTNTKFMDLFYDFTKDECNFVSRKIFEKLTKSDWEAFEEFIVPINHFFIGFYLLCTLKRGKCFGRTPFQPWIEGPVTEILQSLVQNICRR